MRGYFRRPSPSTVIASIALVAALGGTSYAASTITGSHIKNNSLTGKDIKNNSLTGKDIKNSSLTSGDVKNGSLRSKDFKASDVPKGPQGPPGPAAFGTLAYVGGPVVAVAPLEEGYVEAVCPAGTVPTGGGISSSGEPLDETPPFEVRNFTINSSYPFLGAGGAGWAGYVENNTATAQTSQAVVICAPASAIGTSALKLMGKRRR